MVILAWLNNSTLPPNLTTELYALIAYLQSISCLTQLSQLTGAKGCWETRQISQKNITSMYTYNLSFPFPFLQGVANGNSSMAQQFHPASKPNHRALCFDCLSSKHLLPNTTVTTHWGKGLLGNKADFTKEHYIHVHIQPLLPLPFPLNSLHTGKQLCAQ